MFGIRSRRDTCPQHIPRSGVARFSSNSGITDGSQQNIYVAKRPGVDEFLARVSEKFEVVIFTASLAHYADPVIDFLTVGMNKHLVEPREINLRLYRRVVYSSVACM